MVTVVIPCYNAAPFLERAVKSALKQLISGMEIILVNNNSTDETADVIEELIDKYGKEAIIIHADEPKKGACAARNKGLSLAGNDFIQFLDADDEILEGKLKRQLQLIGSAKADIVSGTYEFVAPNAIIKRRIKKPHSDMWKGLISTQLGITSANLWRKEALLQIDGWDESLSSSQEYDLLFRLLKNENRLVPDYELSCFVYAEDNSVSRSGNAERINRIIDNYVNLRLRIREYLMSKGLFGEDVQRCFNITLYLFLLYRKRFSPSYVKEKLSTLKLNVPFAVKVKVNANIAIQKILSK